MFLRNVHRLLTSCRLLTPMAARNQFVTMTDCRLVFVGPQLRHCSSAQNKDLKNNKDVKDILNDLYKDFGVDGHAVDEAKEEEVEVVAETKAEEANAGDADINKLLSELYGDEGDQEEHISISGYKKFRDEDATIIYDVDEERILRRRAEEEGVDLLPSERPKKQDNLDKYGDIINVNILITNISFIK